MFLYNICILVYVLLMGKKILCMNKIVYMRIIKIKIFLRFVYDLFVNFYRVDEMGKNDFLVKNLIYIFKKVFLLCIK